MAGPDVEAGEDPDARKMTHVKEFDFEATPDPILTQTEKMFLLTAEKGDLAGVKRHIEEHKGNPKDFNINCVDPLGRTALLSAIENENFELIELLLNEGIEVKDALLHAIFEEYVEGVEYLLEWEESHHKPGEPYSWETLSRQSSTFTHDITPLILAAHKNNYEILKLLLDRGASLPMPHDIKCGCDECLTSSEQDSLRHSQSRINAYKALSASSLIALSSRDPVLTSFELSAELRRLSSMETEFRNEYTEMRVGVLEFVTQLLDHARTSIELEVMLNFNQSGGNWEPGERQTLDRLKLAIKYSQKQFVSHPNVQQLLAAIWYDGLPGFRRKTMLEQVLQVVQMCCMFPLHSTMYILAPESENAKFMKKPFVKFISESASYFMFLMALGAASQRVEQLAMYLAGHFLNLPFLIEILADWKHRERGLFPGVFECFIIIYITALIWGEVRSLYGEGLMEYIEDLWNIVDFISHSFYVAWIFLRFSAFFIIWRDKRNGFDPYIPREHWDSFDPMLISEGAFAAGMIFSFLKLVHIFSINPHMGPLQVSLGRMIIDIIKFFFIYTLVLFAFGCGMNQLLWYYSELEMNKCYHTDDGLPDFDEQEKPCTVWRRFANIFETSQSLFWASFGLVDLVSFDLQGIKGFTRFWALLLFGSYSVINIIVLLNMLIAMMSNSYTIISERADVEWKFARTMLWISYFDDGDTLPAPFNLCPTMKNVKRFLGMGDKDKTTQSIKKRGREKAQRRHDAVMRLLIKRYVTSEQRRRDDFGVTEDDILEVRQDISSMRFELIDILGKNGMKVAENQKGDLAGKKGKVMERRIMKDFQIGVVEDSLGKQLASSAGEGKKDVFGSLAKVLGKKGEKSKEEWNNEQRRNSAKADPIGLKRSIKAKNDRKSLRKKILDQANAGETVKNDTLLAYNPNLGEVTRATRQAYVKFMIPKIKKDDVIGPAPAKITNAASLRNTGSQKPSQGAAPTGAAKPKEILKKPAEPTKPAADATKTAAPKPPTTAPPAAPAAKKAAEPAKVGVAAPPKEAAKTESKPVKSPADPPKAGAGTADAKPKEPAKKPEAAGATLKPEVERVEIQGSPSRGTSKVSGKVVSGWL